MSTTNYNCDQCGKPCTAKTVIYDRYKTHFCGKECKAAHQRGAKDRAKDERIRELEAEVAEKGREMDRLAEMVRDEAAENARLWAEVIGDLDRYRSMRSEYKALEQRNRRLRDLALAGWTSCLLCLLWALWGQFGRHLSTAAPVPIEHSAYLPPTTKPDVGELVVGMQGDDRTPHIAYVDSLGEWRDADNGERLEVTKWSRP